MADELQGLAADMTSAPWRARPFVRKALEVTARNIKDAWSDNASVDKPQGFVKAYPVAIDYDMQDGITSITAEIGPSPKRPGGTAGFLEDGTVTRGPQHAGRDALEANEQDFLDGLAKAAADAILRKG